MVGFKNSILVTNSGINRESGGGVVGFNIMGALEFCSDLLMTISSDKSEGVNKTLNPTFFGYPADPPFMMDYLAYHYIQDVSEPIGLAVFYGDPFGITVERLKDDNFCKIVSDLAPHNVELSREEHMKYAGQYPFPHLTDEFLYRMYSKHLRLSDVVAVHSHKSAEYIKDKAKLSDMPRVIPHGHYPPTVVPELPNEFKVGYFGALGLDKGVIYLLHALDKINVNSNVKCFFGGKESVNLPNVYTVVQGKSWWESVGFVKDLSDFYKNISVYVQPSVSEGFGITPLEAMSYGRPVIVSEGCGVADLVEDGKEGFVVPIRSPDAIVEKMQYFMDNPSEVRRMGVNARFKSQRYTWEKIKREYVRVFLEMML